MDVPIYTVKESEVNLMMLMSLIRLKICMQQCIRRSTFITPTTTNNTGRNKDISHQSTHTHHHHHQVCGPEGGALNLGTQLTPADPSHAKTRASRSSTEVWREV